MLTIVFRAPQLGGSSSDFLTFKQMKRPLSKNSVLLTKENKTKQNKNDLCLKVIFQVMETYR